MTQFGIGPEDLRRLARLVEENGLSELRYEDGDLRITLRTAAHRHSAVMTSAPTVLEYVDDDRDTSLSSETIPPDARPSFASGPLVPVEAPVMGVFYRAPGPGTPPFVEVGDMVEAGQPVGMIEAMKVFSEVLAEVAGVVREFPAKNGALVQPGETLMVVEVLE